MIRYCYVPRSDCGKHKCSWRCGVETDHLPKSDFGRRLFTCPRGKALVMGSWQKRNYDGSWIPGAQQEIPYD